MMAAVAIALVVAVFVLREAFILTAARRQSRSRRRRWSARIRFVFFLSSMTFLISYIFTGGGLGHPDQGLPGLVLSLLSTAFVLSTILMIASGIAWAFVGIAGIGAAIRDQFAGSNKAPQRPTSDDQGEADNRGT